MRCALAGPRVHREQQPAGRHGAILAAFPRRPERGKPEGHCLSSLILQPCAERGCPHPSPLQARGQRLPPPRSPPGSVPLGGGGALSKVSAAFPVAALSGTRAGPGRWRRENGARGNRVQSMRDAAGGRLIQVPYWGAPPGFVSAPLALLSPFALGPVHAGPTAQVSVISLLQFPEGTGRGNFRLHVHLIIRPSLWDTRNP